MLTFKCNIGYSVDKLKFQMCLRSSLAYVELMYLILLGFSFRKYNHFKIWKTYKKEIALPVFLAIENEI